MARPMGRALGRLKRRRGIRSNAQAELPPRPPVDVETMQRRALTRLFLTLFSRGRGQRRALAPRATTGVGGRLASVLATYGLFGAVALVCFNQPLMVLSVYLQSFTFLMLGTALATSMGEVLFNEEESDILMHRPIPARALVSAKIGMLVRVALWMAGALNLVGFIIGVIGAHGSWWFIPAHVLSTVTSALFCTAGLVLTYQLGLRWFGRERLTALLTTTQVITSISIVLVSQIMPRLIERLGGKAASLAGAPWWVRLLPPVWFAGIDDALSGTGNVSSWELAAVGIAATALVLWLAVGKLAGAYEAGMRALNENAAPVRPRSGRRRWLDVAVHAPPLRWWLRDSAARASFVLTVAYLLRDRDVKLRVYPGLAPMLVIPLLPLLDRHSSLGPSAPSPFLIAFVGTYLGLIPYVGLDLLRYSQHWEAADLFRVVPLSGPARLANGARRAVLLVLTAPMVVVVAALVVAVSGATGTLALFLSGIVALPIFAMIPSVRHVVAPLSQAPDVAQSPRRTLSMFGVMVVSGIVSGLAAFAWSRGFFWTQLVVEAIVVAVLYTLMRAAAVRARWEPV
jgi:hypothetical protein